MKRWLTPYAKRRQRQICAPYSPAGEANGDAETRASRVSQILIDSRYFADGGPEDMDDRALEEGRPRGRAPGVAIQRAAQETTLGKRARER